MNQTVNNKFGPIAYPSGGEPSPFQFPADVTDDRFYIYIFFSFFLLSQLTNQPTSDALLALSTRKQPNVD
jgi:hypothetical protein